MDAWRLCRRPHANLSGEGARIFGGRWNSPGRPMVYLADHPALAALEVRVHLDVPFDLLPDDFVLMRVSLPDDLVTDLNFHGPEMSMGDLWLKEEPSAAVRVRSVLIQPAWNILLNPLHPAAARTEVADVNEFRFDPRLWRPLGGPG